MNAKKWMLALVALAMCGTAHALISEEIATVLDGNIGTYSCSGNSDWFATDAIYHNGTRSMCSGAISPNGWQTLSSILTMSIDLKEATYLSFWFKVSCYNDTSYAKFHIVVDGATYDYCGEKDWTKMTRVLTPGHHTIKWEFIRYYSANGGSNCAWIDDISIEPIMPEADKVEVTDIQCQQRYPWNGMVDIDYTVASDDPDADVWVYPIGYDKDSNTSMAPRALTGDGVDAPVKAGTHRMTWTVTDDYPDFHSTAFTVKMIALTGAAPYMVVDLSGGVDALSYPVSYLSSVPEGGWGDEYKTTKLVLRLIPPGSFMMGSPSDENGRGNYEDLHGVVLTKPFYIGVFEVTQKQYELVMGANPSGNKGEMRPVENVSYNNIRGSVNGAGWPTHNQVDADSFMGRLRSKVNMLFDLPTEAQWEYACRAGTSTSLNSGKNYDGGANCNEVARWNKNRENYDYYGRVWDGKGGYTQTTKVGCYRENTWGLYDMHGNVWEHCRDWWNYGLGVAGVIDPKGSTTRQDNRYNSRVIRGGSYGDESGLRSAYRASSQDSANTSSSVGFRVMCSPVAE
jgi:formylglycine-generating enzyme required for sulfatase activity